MVEGLLVGSVPLLLRFAGFTLDLAGCVLLDPAGVPRELTRGEFVMLRTFVQAPGRVLSRDALLDAVAGRRGDVFDRSVDMMVGRLRRKIEADPKQPRLIVTVPGLGYKFCAAVSAGPTHPASDVAGPAPLVDVPTAAGSGTGARAGIARRRAMAVGAAVLAAAALGGLAVWRQRSPPGEGHPVAITLLPFTNIGESGQEYFADGVAFHLAYQLGSFPAIRILAAPTAAAIRDQGPMLAARAIGADYALQAGVAKTADRVHITAQMFETRSGAALWADQFDATATDPMALQEDIAERVAGSLSGWRGAIYQAGMREAWRKATPSLEEYDYLVRGHAYYFRFTREGTLAARAIWQEGLQRFPGSALLRSKLAVSHMWMFMNGESEDIEADVAAAWELLRQSDAIQPQSPLVTYLNHWVRAIVRQWRNDDFAGSVADLREALRMVPYEPMLRADAAWLFANAGLPDEAIRHGEWAVTHSPSPPGWYFGNLGWAYLIAGRNADVLDANRTAGGGFDVQLTAALVRLGRVDGARAAIAMRRAVHPRDNIAAEARWPLIEPYKAALLRDLRTAGLPEH